MASDVTVVIKSRGAQQVVQEIHDVGDAGDKASGGIGRLGGALGQVAKIAGGFVVAQGLLQLPGFLSGAAQAAIEDEAATLRLEQALRNVGGAFDENLASVNERIAAGQKLAYGDDAVRDSFQQLLAATGDVDEALRRQALAMDFARGANIPLEQASRLLGKVTAENVEAFKRMGITIGEGATEAEAFAVIQEKFGGQAAAYAASTAGQFEQLKIRFGEMKEQLGAALLPVLLKVGNAFLAVLPTIEMLVTGGIELAATGFEKLRAAVEAALALLKGPAVAAFDAVRDAAMAVADFVGSVFDKLKGPAVAAFDKVRDAAVKSFDLIKAGATKAFEVAKQKAEEWGRALVATVGPALEGVGRDVADFARGLDFGEIKTAVFEELVSAFGKLKDALAPVLPLWKELSQEIVAELLPALKEIGRVFMEEMGPAMESLGPAAEKLLPVLKALGIVLGVTLIAAITAVLYILRELVPLIEIALVAAIRVVATVIEGLAKVFEGAFTAIEGLWNTFKGLFTGDWDLMWKGIKQIFEGVLLALEGVVTTAFGFVQIAFETAYAALNSLTQGKLGELVAWFAALPGNIVSAVGDLTTFLKQKGIDLVQGMWDGFTELFNKMKLTTLFTMGGDIVSALGDATMWLLEVGKDVVRGLWDGMLAMKDWLLEKLGWLLDQIPGWAKTFLGISSPSKLMADEVGRPIVEGIAQGMLDAIPVLDAAKNVIGRIVGGELGGGATPWGHGMYVPGSGPTTDMGILEEMAARGNHGPLEAALAKMAALDALGPTYGLSPWDQRSLAGMAGDVSLSSWLGAQQARGGMPPIVVNVHVDGQKLFEIMLERAGARL